MSRILVLDDNLFELQAYIRELRIASYDVVEVSHSRDFFDVLAGNDPIDLFILDVMIGEPYLELHGDKIETNQGLETGIMIAKALRANGVNSPIILFSTSWVESVHRDVANFEGNDSNTAFLRKYDLSPEQLKDFIDDLFSKGKIVKEQSWLKIIGNAILLKPAIFGIGIDIQKIRKNK